VTRTVILPTTPYRTLLAVRVGELPASEWKDAQGQYAATYEGFTVYGDTIQEACDSLAAQLTANA